MEPIVQLECHMCYCTEPRVHTWWTTSKESTCLQCHKRSHAIATEWIRGVALFECHQCNDKRWFVPSAGFDELSRCAVCHRFRAPVMVTRNGSMPARWNSGEPYVAPDGEFAWHAHNALVVTNHADYTYRGILTSGALREAFGHERVVLLAAHWLVLSWFPDEQHKGRVNWSDDQGRCAVRTTRAAVAAVSKDA